MTSATSVAIYLLDRAPVKLHHPTNQNVLYVTKGMRIDSGRISAAPAWALTKYHACHPTVIRTTASRRGPKKYLPGHLDKVGS